MSSTSRKRGRASEARVEQALNIILTQGKDESGESHIGIKRYIKSKQNSNLDRHGVDFIVELPDNRQIPLQVKSSEKHRVKFERKRRWKHLFFIPVVVAHVYDDMSQIINRVKKAIKLALSLIERRVNRIREMNNRRSRRRQRYVMNHVGAMSF